MDLAEFILNISEWTGVVAVTLLLTLNLRSRVKPVAFKYQPRETIISIILAFVLIAAAIYVNLVLKVPTLPDGSSEHGTAQLLWAAASLMPVALLLVIRRQPLLSIGLSRPGMMPGALLGLALVIVTIFLNGKIYSLLDGVSAEEFNYLVLCLVLALAGELIFRGFLQLRFMGWADRNRGWLLASLAHFLFCLPFIWLTSGGDLLLFRVPAAHQLLQSLLLGWIMRRSGNVLAGGLYQAAHFWVAIL